MLIVVAHSYYHKVFPLEVGRRKLLDQEKSDQLLILNKDNHVFADLFIF